MYFSHTYVSGSFRHIQQPDTNGHLIMPLRIRQLPPLFTPHLCNVHLATLNNNPCTNNICEEWNNKFYNLIWHYHPSIWRVIQWFEREETTVRTIILQNSVGRWPQMKVCRRYVQMQRLRNLCVARDTVPGFLRGVGWNICLNHE